MRLNGVRMKNGAKWLMSVLALALLASCGECPCKANSDYLRDVPVTRTRQFQ